MRRLLDALFVAVIALVAGMLSTGRVEAQDQWHQASGVGDTVDLVVRSSNNSIVAAVRGSSPGIYKSTNGGMTFTLAKSFTLPHRVENLGGVIFAATSQGLYKSSDPGLTTWTKIGGGIPASGRVTYVKHILGEPLMFATVAGTSPGLYRSTDSGSTWTMILPNVGAQAVAKGHQCGDANINIFAGGLMHPGGLACTLWISRDDGQTWSCSSYPSVVGDLQLDCSGNEFTNPNWRHLFITSGDLGSATVVSRSTDLGETFAADDIGIPDGGASNIDSVGSTVGSLSAGIFERGVYVPVGTPWTQFSTEGLTNQRINRWIRWISGSTNRYVVATPSGVFYFGGDPPPCEFPCP